MIKSIEIEIDTHTVKLSLDQAKQLQRELNELMNDTVIYRDWYPYRPYWTNPTTSVPQFEYTTTASNVGAVTEKLCQTN